MKAAKHLDGRPQPQLDGLRSLLDTAPGYFVSKADPAEVVVDVSGMPVVCTSAAELPPHGAPTEEDEDHALARAEALIEDALARAAAQGEEAVGRVFLRQPLLHVQCRDLAAAHWLMKECNGLADAAAVGIDAAKIVVRLCGRGRPLEIALPTPAAPAARRLAVLLLRSREELLLLTARLERSLGGSAPDSD